MFKSISIGRSAGDKIGRTWRVNLVGRGKFVSGTQTARAGAARPGAVERSSACAQGDALAGTRPSRSRIPEGDGRRQETPATGLPHRQRNHVSGLGHRVGRDGSRDGEPDRGRRRSRGRRRGRIRRTDGRDGRTARREGAQGRGRMGPDNRAGAGRGGAQVGPLAEAGRDRARGNLHRGPSAGRGNRQDGASARSDVRDGRGDLARLRAGGNRPARGRHLLFVHAKGNRRAAGIVADHFQRARDGVGAKAQAKVPLVVSRRER